MKKFIGAGTSRRVYQISDTECIKIPILGREETGILQNKIEHRNIFSAYCLGLTCFPKVISVSKNFKKLTVEKCEPLQSSNEFSNIYFDDFNKCGCYNDMPDYDTLKYFAFGICTFFYNIVRYFKIFNYQELYNLCSINEKFYLLKDTFTTIYTNTVYHNEYAENFLKLVITNNDSKYQIFKDIFKFYLEYPANLLLADLWNYHQWGKIKDRLVILDAGYNINLANSKYYGRWDIIKENITKANPGDGLIFNGKNINDINDPNGNKILYKFFTEKNSEYILSKNQQAMRIKDAGLIDDGLWDWTDKTVFVQAKDAYKVLEDVFTVLKTQTPVKVDFNHLTSKINFKKIDDKGLWKTFLKVSKISFKPIIGMHPVEFLFDKNIIRNFHVGHEISYIEGESA